MIQYSISNFMSTLSAEQTDLISQLKDHNISPEKRKQISAKISSINKTLDMIIKLNDLYDSK